MINLSAQLPKGGVSVARQPSKPNKSPVKSRYCRNDDTQFCPPEMVILSLGSRESTSAFHQSSAAPGRFETGRMHDSHALVSVMNQKSLFILH
jgi:hypothetical protein